MSVIWTAVIVTIAVVVIILAVTVVALAREVGLLARRLPPAPALDAQQGPEVGDIPPLVEAMTLNGKQVTLTGLGGDSRMLLFVSTRCQPCRELISDMAGIRKDWPTQHLIAVVSGSRSEVNAIERQFAGADIVWDEQGRVSRHLSIEGLPFGLVIESSGRIAARGVTNNREMVASLLDGRVRGVPADAWIEQP
jgi:methylamine dehydrogenase accessory protein MauD